VRKSIEQERTRSKRVEAVSSRFVGPKPEGVSSSWNPPPLKRWPVRRNATSPLGMPQWVRRRAAILGLRMSSGWSDGNSLMANTASTIGVAVRIVRALRIRPLDSREVGIGERGVPE
jgi:hypothetical protein